MASAWVYQDDKQVKKYGGAAASWYVGWYEPDGRKKCKSCGPGLDGKRRADRLRRKLEAELMTGTYQMHVMKTWDEFHAEYDAKVLSRLAPRSRDEALTALAHFKRIVKPVRLFALCTAHVDNFIAARRREPGKKQGDLVSPATVNKDLRHLKAAFTKARKWGYVKDVPDFAMERTVKHLPTYVNGDHFAAIYAACERARMPQDLANANPADWWRALIVMGYMTGWRIGDLLALRRDDLDLKAGTAVTRGEDNKGGRDALVGLHPVVLDHLRKLAGFDTHVFPWNHNRRTLDEEFHRIQKVAGIHLACRGTHKHTEACHLYGFHDLRRAFATMNADKLTPDALQTLMRHKSYQTTQVYIDMTRQLDAAVAGLHVPGILRATAAEQPYGGTVEGQAR
jgi:integrase